MQVNFRLLQPSHGCVPEHLIFCLRHRVQLDRVSVSYETQKHRKKWGKDRGCLKEKKSNNNIEKYKKKTYAFKDLFVTRDPLPAMRNNYVMRPKSIDRV